jgi:topoisomerase IA-like protein
MLLPVPRTVGLDPEGGWGIAAGTGEPPEKG